MVKLTYHLWGIINTCFVFFWASPNPFVPPSQHNMFTFSRLSRANVNILCIFSKWIKVKPKCLRKWYPSIENRAYLTHRSHWYKLTNHLNYKWKKIIWVNVNNHAKSVYNYPTWPYLPKCWDCYLNHLYLLIFKCRFQCKSVY